VKRLPKRRRRRLLGHVAQNIRPERFLSRSPRVRSGDWIGP
jgi:hypothetical protein